MSSVRNSQCHHQHLIVKASVLEWQKHYGGYPEKCRDSLERRAFPLPAFLSAATVPYS